MKAEPVLARLNELRKDAQGEGGPEEEALHHAFCFISYEIGPFTEFVEQEKEPSDRKGVPPGARAREMLGALEEMRGEVAGDPDDMEFVALDRAVGFLSRALGDFQSYLDEIGGDG